MSMSHPSQSLRLLALAAAAALVLGAPVMAQAEGTASGSATSSATTAMKKHAKGGEDEQTEMNEHLQKMTKKLKLTDDQVPKVREILQSKMSEMSEMRAKYKDEPRTPENKAAMEKAHQELHADIEAKLASVLTPEQMTAYKKMSAEHMKKESAKEEKEEAKEAKK